MIKIIYFYSFFYFKCDIFIFSTIINRHPVISVMFACFNRFIIFYFNNNMLTLFDAYRRPSNTNLKSGTDTQGWSLWPTFLTWCCYSILCIERIFVELDFTYLNNAKGKGPLLDPWQKQHLPNCGLCCRR